MPLTFRGGISVAISLRIFVLVFDDVLFCVFRSFMQSFYDALGGQCSVAVAFSRLSSYLFFAVDVCTGLYLAAGAIHVFL